MQTSHDCTQIINFFPPDRILLNIQFSISPDGELYIYMLTVYEKYILMYLYIYINLFISRSISPGGELAPPPCTDISHQSAPLAYIRLLNTICLFWQNDKYENTDKEDGHFLHLSVFCFMCVTM